VRPAYQQVADQLLELILSGSLSLGDRLPSEAELCGIFDITTDYCAEVRATRTAPAAPGRPDRDHREILHCIEAGDGEGAAQSMKAHLVASHRLP
jgi:DNA-binding FadR family transcriptional regulator